MRKIIYISEDQVNLLKRNKAKDVTDDEYVIGGETNAPCGGNFYHTSINESFYNISIRGDLDSIDAIEFTPYEDNLEEDEEQHYDVDGYDKNGDIVVTGDFTIEELLDTFGESIVNDIIERNANKIGRDRFRIDDLLSRDSTPSNINDVQEVNAIAKRLSTGGPSAYLLTDGDIISFYDHSNIACVDGMTPCKFVALGNIRVGNGGIELIKAPTYEQEMKLQHMIANTSDFYVDIAVDDGYTYPKVVWGKHYIKPSAEIILQDIENYFNGNQEGVEEAVSENMEQEVDSSEVDLSSFKKRGKLADIWDDEDTLNSRVRLRLLDIADDFWDFTDVSWVEPKGVILTGSICNYNWSKYSDIDLHLIVDFKEVDERVDFVKEYFDAKKNEWNDTHDKLRIYGYTVELYVQDVTESPQAEGVYDLEENKWVKKPSPSSIESIKLEKFPIKDKAAEIMTIIDNMYDDLQSTNDNHKIEEIGDDAYSLWDKIKAMRKKSLEIHGESGKGNIVYKVLRREGYLDKLYDLFSITYDRTNSIDESVLREYLDKDYNMPLYHYFKYWRNASDFDKATEFAYRFYYQIMAFVDDKCYDYDDFQELWDYEAEIEENCNEEYIERFLQLLKEHDLCKAFIGFIEHRNRYDVLPTWVICEFERIVTNEWCIHFTNDSMSVARNGFTNGTDDIDNLAYTVRDAKSMSHSGYNFAYPIDSREVDMAKYGDEAVLFQTSGVLVWHYGDEEDQVIFYGPNAKNFIPITKDEYSGEWAILGNNNQILKSGKPSELVDWAIDNLPQYRKQIMIGKNGFNIKKKRYNEAVIREDTDFEDAFHLAKEYFGVTYDVRECGFIPPDGSMLDLSGAKNGGSGGYRAIDHKEVNSIGVQLDDFVKMGAIRCDFNNGIIDIGRDTTPQQDEKIARLCKRNDGYVELELSKGFSLDESDYVNYEGVNYNRVISDIHKFYQEGIKPSIQNNKIREMAEYLKLFKPLNEEVVADGDSDRNPYAKRWETERKALKDFLVNYGKVMTSKENGKQYKVYYDKTLSDLIGHNYCICLQWDNVRMKPESTIYVRALDKFTERIFQAKNDAKSLANEGVS